MKKLLLLFLLIVSLVSFSQIKTGFTSISETPTLTSDSIFTKVIMLNNGQKDTVLMYFDRGTQNLYFYPGGLAYISKYGQLTAAELYSNSQIVLKLNNQGLKGITTPSTGYVSMIVLNSFNKIQIGDTTKDVDISIVNDVEIDSTLTVQVLSVSDSININGSDYIDSITSIDSITHVIFKQTQLSGSLTDGAPTDAEIDVIIGSTPAVVGSGYRRTIRDTDGTSLLYRIESDGLNWFYWTSTQAL